VLGRDRSTASIVQFARIVVCAIMAAESVPVVVVSWSRIIVIGVVLRLKRSLLRIERGTNARRDVKRERETIDGDAREHGGTRVGGTRNAGVFPDERDHSDEQETPCR
jgi:hypothetical protein